MAIITKNHCDKCQAEIAEEADRPGFPQLSWCYYRQGLQRVTDSVGLPFLRLAWFGKVNRVELCQKHGSEFNAIFKRFIAGDARIEALLKQVTAEDTEAWDQRNLHAEAEHNQALAALKKPEVSKA